MNVQVNVNEHSTEDSSRDPQHRKLVQLTCKMIE